MQHLSDEQLIDYLEEGKSDSHLENCAICQNTFQEISRVFSSTRSLLRSTIPEIAPETNEAILQMISTVPLRVPRFSYRQIFLAAATLLLGASGVFLLSSEKIVYSESLAASSSPISTHETNEDKPLLQEVPILKTEEMSETKTEGTPETKNKDIVTKTQEEIPVSNPPVEQEGENLNPKEEPIKEQPQYEVQKNWICGDLNQNGKLDVGDPVLLMRNLQKKQSVTPELGDVNTDGKVDFLDVHTLARQMVES